MPNIKLNRACPPKLLEWIEMTNLLPSSEREVGQATSLLTDIERGLTWDDTGCTWLHANLSPEVFEYLERNNVIGDAVGMIETAIELFNIARTLRKAAKISVNEYPPYSTPEDYDNIEFINSYYIAEFLGPNDHAWFKNEPLIVGDGERRLLKFSKSGFVEFLNKFDIDIRLIRVCGNCSGVFWARTERQTFCSTKCGKEIRDKTYWSENNEQINKNRKHRREMEKKGVGKVAAYED